MGDKPTRQERARKRTARRRMKAGVSWSFWLCPDCEQVNYGRIRNAFACTCGWLGSFVDLVLGSPYQYPEK